MQFFKLSALLFASIAVADHLHGVQHFHHRRQLNSSSSAISTTLTIYQTLVHTITSCAPTITNCPARSSAGAGVITDVIVLTTMVCPVTAADSIASSIISVAGGSSSAFTNTPISSAIGTPLGTGASSIGGSSKIGGSDTSSPSERVLTYTLGGESSTTVITTTLKQTSTTTEYFTQYITRSRSTPALPTGEGAAQTGAVDTQTEVVTSQDKPTTTITSSSTMTRYITVMLAPSASVPPTNVVAAVSTAGGNGSDSGSGSCECAGVAPVTVTVALATVTVTYSPMGASPTATPVFPATSPEIVNDAAASSLANTPTTTADVVNSVTSSSYSLSSGTASAIVSPPAIISNGTAPYGNGTSIVTKCYNGTTGFLTVAKSSQTVSANY